MPGSEATPTTTRIVAERDVDFGAGDLLLVADWRRVHIRILVTDQPS